jgi:hypothetical protein
MTPAEVDLLILDLRSELVPQSDSADARERLVRYHGLLDAFCRDWRQLYALHGAERTGWPEFAKLRDTMREMSRAVAEGLVMRTNRVGAHSVLEGRVLRPMLTTEAREPNKSDAPAARSAEAPSPASRGGTEKVPAPAARSAHAQSPAPNTAATFIRAPMTRARLEQPLFIIAAPRSGSTLLFETLAVSEHLYTLGGEGHELIEGIPDLQPGAAGVESNRLDTDHVNTSIADRIIQQMLDAARDAHGRPASGDTAIRFLEKTPKNALRIPFLDRIFPDARFIVLWRDPRENLGSIIDAWRSGQWKTYNGLPGFDGPWSLLLPPGWRAMNGRPLEEIAAFQWDSTYRIVLDDLGALPRERWTSLSYGELIGDTAATIRHLCEFARIEFDQSLAQHVTRPLPLSRYTLAPPAPDKWRRHEREIARVLPAIEATWRRLQTLEAEE